MFAGREASTNSPGLVVTGSLFDQSVTLFKSWSNGTLEYVDHIFEGERLIGRFQPIDSGMIHDILGFVIHLLHT
jgi:hypothetical protein